ncbi:hypothetical protein DY000_02036358 [Brassica cretica]|uniref:Uncharacterized protein n=1 Tax=Brassica cretica TaxID=69181 RepID=A0ABQ7BNB1_BRACR|nr:hypothetical protein DY000_02036358 [Brassica cretica]
MKERERKPITEKLESKLETRNNLSSSQSIHEKKALSKLRVANMAKLRDTRDASSDESCNEMREHIGKERQNEIGKP